MRVLRPDDPQYRDRRRPNRPPGGPDNRETPEGKRRLLPERRLRYLGIDPAEYRFRLFLFLPGSPPFTIVFSPYKIVRISGTTSPPALGKSQRPTKRGGIDFPQLFPGQLDIYQPNFDSDDQKQNRIKIDNHDFLLPWKFSTRALLYHVVSLN